MPAAAVPAVTVVSTKQASGNVQILFHDSLSSGVRFSVVLTNADLINLFNNVGQGFNPVGSQFVIRYAQDANKLDYPQDIVFAV